MTLSGDSDLETIESTQADIPYQVTLSRINGASIQQLPAPVRVSLVAVGTPSNTISGNNYYQSPSFDICCILC